jgi:hypothetical protein
MVTLEAALPPDLADLLARLRVRSTRRPAL